MHAMQTPDLRFTEAAEHLGDSVVVANALGEIVFANKTMLTTYGYSADEVVGQPVSFLKSGLNPKEVYADLWPLLLSGNPWRGRLVNRRKDGSLLDVELVISPVPAGPSPEWFIAIQRDMAEARRLERAIAQLAALGSLAAGIVHDLRGPLALVKGGADLAQRKLARSTPETKGSMDFQQEFRLVREGAQRIETLIEEIMRLSRAGAEVADVAVYWTDPVTSALFVLGSALAGVNVEVEVEPGVATMASHVDLERIVMDLVDNAIYAAQAGQGSAAVSVKVAREGDSAVLTVTDSGPGIPSQVRSRLFSAAVTTKPPGRGTGLGLMVVAELVRKHGGTVAIASSGAEGTTVRVVLPVARRLG